MKRRASGILCHITSLPSPYGIGDLGQEAYAFADFLCRAKQNFWQVLPLNPTNQRYLDSPFSSVSSCAGNAALISPDLLVSEGFLTRPEVEDHPPFDAARVDYEGASHFKQHLFLRAHARFKERGRGGDDFARFCSGNAAWLEDHALYTAITARLDGAALTDWPEDVSDRHGSKVAELAVELEDAVEREKFLQYVFYKQWTALKNYCNGKGIRIIGDFPMFMNYDAADIWAFPEFFKVDQKKKPLFLAGSPPDTFSENGQLFNCAVYNWDALKADCFRWWVRRFHYLFKLYDVVRIDHFRGLVSCWEVPAGEENALKGAWQPVPGEEFLEAMVQHFPTFPVIAEDLGVITAEVREMMERYGIPGMKVLVVGFQDDAKIYLPHSFGMNSVVYTGTHDTNTAVGWFEESDEAGRGRLCDYLGRRVEVEGNWELIRLALMSVARTSIVQMQDVLGGGAGTRMNKPGKTEGNWQWRIRAADLSAAAERLAAMTVRFGRAR